VWRADAYRNRENILKTIISHPSLGRGGHFLSAQECLWRKQASTEASSSYKMSFFIYFKVVRRRITILTKNR